MIKHFRVLGIVAAVVVASLAGAGVAMAASTPAQPGVIKPALNTNRFGTSVTRVSIQTNDSAVTFSGAAFVNVGSTTVFAATGQLIDARFTAESACNGGLGSGWCVVRVVIDGAEAEPVVGTDFAFDSPDSTTVNSWESHSVERVRPATFTGNHTVVVQTAQVGPETLRLDDWVLTAMAIAQ